MSETTFCCGQIPQKKKKFAGAILPENPKIDAGIEVIYLDSGETKVDGKITGLTYYASDHRRRFVVHRDDLDSVLKVQGFFLKP